MSKLYKKSKYEPLVEYQRENNNHPQIHVATQLEIMGFI